MSKKKLLQIADEKAVRQGYLEHHPYCEAQRAGAPGSCYGAIHVHEPWTRARGGPTDDPLNMRAVCDHHNLQISQDSETMQWAKEYGFLVSAHHGAEWLSMQKHSCSNSKCQFKED